MPKLNIDEILKTWGEKKRALPADNEALKSRVLAQTPAPSAYFAGNQAAAHWPWASMAFATLALLVFLGNSIGFRPQQKTTDIFSMPAGAPKAANQSYDEGGERNLAVPEFYSTGYSTPPAYYGGNPPITDTREFLKKYYNATIKTRDVAAMTSKVEVAVRGFGGRIDSLQSGEEYGHVSFAVPESKFDSFREEIRSLTGKKLILENTTSENLLPQKQSIEERQEQVSGSIADLKSERSALTSSHNKTIASHNASLKSLNSQIASLQAEYPNATPERKAQISQALYSLEIEKDSIQSKISSENRNYQNRLAGINQNIKNLEESMDYVNKEDQNLSDNIATVNGTVSLDKVNIWEIGEVYAPGPLLGWVLLLAALLLYFRHRRSHVRPNPIVF